MYLGPLAPLKLTLTPGKFYKSRDGHIWCCFRKDLRKAEHCVADCIRTTDARIEYFFEDGRYDAKGEREHTLVEETVYPSV